MDRRHEPPRRIDEPEPGFYMTRVVRGGPWVGAQIFYEPPHWRAEIDGKPCGYPDADPFVADGVMRIWTYGKRITAEEYHKLLGDKTVPSDQPVDLNKLPPMF